MIAALLGLGWGVLVASPIAARARRRGPTARAGGLVTSDADALRVRAVRLSRVAARLPRPPGVLVRVSSGLAARWRARHDDRLAARDLPVVVDLLAVAVASGCTPYLALEVAAGWAPPVLGEALDGVRRATRLGRSFSDALDDAVAAMPALASVADALLVSDRFGSPVGDALTRLASDLRADLRRRAEARARTVPVRLLFPLVFLVLPAFGLLTVVPAVAAGLAGS
ncbi:MAG TPA: type II secretion system F family protein [Acidimicrobiia bacterium]|nr:type II secretion system F family protein [Acidimicrobiia bacterium]